jgi:hypothetical protein
LNLQNPENKGDDFAKSSKRWGYGFFGALGDTSLRLVDSVST